MNWPRVISRDPDLTDGALQRVHLLVQRPDPLLFSCVDAGLSRTLRLWASVGNRARWLLLHKEKGSMFGPLRHVTPDRFKWQMISLFCTSAAPVVCCRISADCRSADPPAVSLKLLQPNVRGKCRLQVDFCVQAQSRVAPWVCVIMKRLLSSVTPNIRMQESITFPTVVSFGVLR